MDPNEIRAQMERILASRVFAPSQRMSRFLRFTVEEALAGRGGELKEATVGHAVFDRPVDYDARVDPIVRVEARRLRAKIDQYYAHAGAGDPVRIEYPRGGYAPVFHSAGLASKQESSQQAPRTIAVLPFTNLSADPENDYFSDGLTRELIHALTRVPDLRVTAWNSVSQLRDAPRDAAQKLRVDVVLEGTVRRAGDRVRITTQLVDAASGIYRWSESYDREMRDLFDLQEELGRSITMALHVQLARNESLSPMRSSGGSVAAYSLYLKGRHAWSQRTLESLRQSVAFYERALEESAECALAWVGIADSYNLLADHGLESAEIALPKAREAALRALEMDPSLAEAHTSLGLIVSLHDWWWEQAERHYRKAIELNPGYSTVHHWIGCDFFAILGRFDEAANSMAIANQLDPLDAAIADSRSYVDLLRRRYSDAERGYQARIAENPGFAKSYTGLGRVYFAQGRWNDAIAMLERGRTLLGDQPTILGALAQTHGMAGNRQDACRFLNQLQSLVPHRHVPATSLALAKLGLGDKSSALDCLETAAARREPALPGMNVHPAYDALRGEPRFRALLEKMRMA